MSLTDRTHLAPTLSAVVVSALFEAAGNEHKARLLVEDALDDTLQREKILDEEFKYALRAYTNNASPKHPRAA